MDTRPTFRRQYGEVETSEFRQADHWQRLSHRDISRPRPTDIEERRERLTRALDRIGRARSHEVALPRIDIDDVTDSIEELRPT